MDGIHDMGGMHGFGPVEQEEEEEPAFHQVWEGRVLGIVVARPVPIPGGMRNNIENMEPAHYLSSSYHEKWLYAQVKGLVDAGVLTEEELEARTVFFRDHPDATPPRSEDPDRVQHILERLRTSHSSRKDIDVQPAFDIGDAVCARNIHPRGHTRLPRYVRGKRGVVARFYGVYTFQDATPPGVEVPPHPVYAVRFHAGELWGESAEANGAVYLDMWENYLEPARF